MTNPTSNFGWQMPTNTDLVTDLPADFEVFGQAVDTTMADLKGGTSGQVLAKASATDMDFTWTTPEIGDITAITVTAPITGGGTTGSVGIAVSAASTAASGVVQLSDSTSTTSSVLASTPTATKAAYDLANTANSTANAAIAKTTVTTAGDIIYRNATVPTRLGIGTAGQVLTVNSGATAPEWKTISAGGKVLQVIQGTTTTAVSNSTNVAADTTLTATITPSSTTSKVLVLVAQNGLNKSSANSNNRITMNLLRNGTNLALISDGVGNTTSAQQNQPSTNSINYLDSPATTSAVTYKTTFSNPANTASVSVQVNGTEMSTIILMEIGA